MKISIQFLFFFLFLLAVSCKNEPKKEVETSSPPELKVLDVLPKTEAEKPKSFKSFIGLADTTFIRLADFSDDFVYDLRYATINNFLKAKVYDCGECYMRVKTAKALLKANKAFMEKGYKIKFFDCYRPNEVQYKMWAIVPNPQYVANPVKGSIHNKGAAVDISLVTLSGKEVAMGTDFDFFGKKAYHDTTDLPQEILNNRILLKETMEAFGFWSIRTEWWHYNLSSGSNDKVANFKWECND